MPINPCPNCGEEIAQDKINIAEGVGLCDACGKLSRLVDIVEAGDDSDDSTEFSSSEREGVSVDQPPVGCEIDDRGHEIIVRASTRSMGGAVGAGFAAVFWNGIVSVFVLIAIAGLYTNISGRPLPTWFPAPAAGSGPNSIGAGMPLGMTLFLCVFLIPFVLIGSILLFALLLCLFGRNEVRISGESGRVVTAVGPFRWTRRFDATKITRVALGRTTWQENGRSKPAIRIEADRTIRFGSSLREDRRRWMHAALHQLLVVPLKGRSRTLG